MLSKKPPRVVPEWDEFYMGLCFVIASRSKDPSTQHGAIVVDINHRPLGFGYNGTPSLIKDKDISWERPQKYPFILHAEQNAMDHAEQPYNFPAGSIMYVTGMPCPNCAIRMVGRNIRRVVYGPQGSVMVDVETTDTVKEIFRLANATLDEYVGSLNWMRDRMFWLESNLPRLF